MLNDDETTTSSSSNRSNDEEDDDISTNSFTASNDGIASDKCWGDQLGENGYEGASSARDITGTVGVDVDHHKKRIKLSLGGAFKAIPSSPEQEPQEQHNQLNNGKATVLQSKDDIQNIVTTTQHSDDGTGVDTAKNTLTQKEPNYMSPMNRSQNILHTQTKSRISMLPAKKVISQALSIKNNSDVALEVSALARNRAKLNNSSPKLIIAAAAASASIKNKPKEMKRRQLPKLPSPSSIIPGEKYAPTKKRSSMRSIRITPMSSPGLLFSPGSNVRGGGSTNSAKDSSITSFPNSAFTHTMTTAGYTTEARTKNPHRGSSVQRSVDDMFDSNVKFCLRFPKLVPEDLVSNLPSMATAVPSQPSSSDPSATSTISSSTAFSSSKDSKSKSELMGDQSTELKTISVLMKRLTKSFQTKPNDKRLSSPINGDTTSTSARKRYSMIPQYSDIVPLSLTLMYPDEYIQKRLKYVMKVDEREKAIFDLQEKQEILQTVPEAMAIKANGSIPPIPRPPDAPMRDDVREITNIEDIFGSEDQQQKTYPLYLPKNQILVNHLDKRCFHIIHGRYIGLCSNAIADPYFFGPNAPGIGGFNLSASTGLATASTGGGAGSLGAPLFMIPAQPSSLSAVSSKMASTLSTKSTSSNISIVDKSTKIKSSTQTCRDFTKKQSLSKTII